METDFAELVLETEFSERASLTCFDDDFRNRAAETADNGVVFRGDDTTSVVDRSKDCFLIDRFNGVHVQHASIDVVVVFKDLRSLNSLIYAAAARDNGDVVTFVKENGFADFEVVVVVRVNVGVETTVDTNVERTFGVCSRFNRFARFDTVGGADKRHVDKRTDNREVFDCVVGGARLTERRTAVRADDFHVDVLIADVGVNLVKRAERREDGEGRRERNESAFRKTCRHAVHVLFRNTYVNGSFGEFRREVADFRRAFKCP